MKGRMSEPMDHWMDVLLLIFIALVLLQNVIFSKKIATLYEEVQTVEFFLRDGVCPDD